MEYEGFLFTANFSYQKGGTIWNGTQQFLAQEDTTPFIAEAAIEDGSFLNFNQLAITYEWYDPHEGSYSLASFVKTFKISVFANNLHTWSKANGTAPNSAFFDHNSAQGLQFFNQPQQTEVGMKLTAKI